MQRAVTAIYPSADVAQLVRRELTELGVGNHDITILPDLDGSSTFGGDPVDRLHNLGLPEEDMRTYQQAIRNGDYVVSVEVDREDDLSRIQEIMRRPEDAYDLDQLDTQYADADFIPRQQAAYADTGSMGQQGGYGASGLGAAGMAAGAMGGMGMGSDNLGTSARSRSSRSGSTSASATWTRARCACAPMSARCPSRPKSTCARPASMSSAIRWTGPSRPATSGCATR
jgi:hypothetical protein